MFEVVRVKDCIPLPATQMGNDFHASVVQAIEGKYTNRVLPSMGLGVGVYDIASIGEPKLAPGDSKPWVWVEFREIVFLPLVNEVFSGTIIGQSKDKGVQISLRFFESVYVLPQFMASSGTVFWEEPIDEGEGRWVWPSGDGDGEGGEETLFRIQVGMQVRARVHAVQFSGGEGDGAAPKAPPPAENLPFSPHPTPPEDSSLKVLAAFDKAGLGPTVWWSS